MVSRTSCLFSCVFQGSGCTRTHPHYPHLPDRQLSHSCNIYFLATEHKYKKKRKNRWRKEGTRKSVCAHRTKRELHLKGKRPSWPAHTQTSPVSHPPSPVRVSSPRGEPVSPQGQRWHDAVTDINYTWGSTPYSYSPQQHNDRGGEGEGERDRGRERGGNM